VILKDGLKIISCRPLWYIKEKIMTKRTYRQAECCKESQSKECLHCRCCQKLKMWRQLHVGSIYTQIIWQCHQKILLTKPSTSDKHDIDSSCLDFNISKMTRTFVLGIIQTALQMILIFNYAAFYWKLPINERDVCFKKGRVGWNSQPLWPSIHEISNWFRVRWIKNLRPLLKIRTEE